MLLKNIKEETSLVIVPSICYSYNKSKNIKDLSITDDYTYVTINIGDSIYEYESDGFLNILTISEFKDCYDELLNEGYVDTVILINDYKGDINVTVKDTNTLEVYNNYDINNYLINQFDESVYVSLDLKDSSHNLMDLEQFPFNDYVLKEETSKHVLTAYYSVINNGDDSVYPIFMESLELCEWDQDHSYEGFAESCTGSISFSSDSIITSNVPLLTKEGYLIDNYINADGCIKESKEFISIFLPNGIPDFNYIVEDGYVNIYNDIIKIASIYIFKDINTIENFKETLKIFKEKVSK